MRPAPLLNPRSPLPPAVRGTGDDAGRVSTRSATRPAGFSHAGPILLAALAAGLYAGSVLALLLSL